MVSHVILAKKNKFFNFLEQNVNTTWNWAKSYHSMYGSAPQTFCKTPTIGTTHTRHCPAQYSHLWKTTGSIVSWWLSTSKWKNGKKKIKSYVVWLRTRQIVDGEKSFMWKEENCKTRASFFCDLPRECYQGKCKKKQQLKNTDTAIKTNVMNRPSPCLTCPPVSGNNL